MARQPRKVTRTESPEFAPVQIPKGMTLEEVEEDIPMPPGMTGLMTEAVPIRQAWQPAPVSAAQQYTQVEQGPMLTFPEGNRVPLSDLGPNDFLLPMTGDQVKHQLTEDLSIERMTIPAGTIVYQNISGVGVARWLQAGFWIYLVELVDSIAWIYAGADDQWQVYNGPLG